MKTSEGQPKVSLLGWWLAELRACVPAPLRRLVGLERRVLVLSADNGGLQASDGRPAEALRGFRGAVALRLSPEQSLSRDLRLPLAAEPDLAQALEFEIDRHTPFRAAEVYRGWRVTGRDRDARQLQVRLNVAPRETVDRLLDQAARLGLRPVAVSGPDGLPFAGAGLPPRTGIGGFNATLLVLLVLLLAAAAAAPPLRQAMELRAVRGEIEALRPQAEEVLALAEARDRLSGAAAGVLAAHHAAPPVTRILEEVTALLPDDTWLGQLNVVDGRVELEGTSASAAALVGLLEASPLFGTVSFRAPVVADPVTKREHFQYAVTLVAP